MKRVIRYLAVLAVLAAGPARGDEHRERGPGAGLAAVIPGLLVHGSGHVVAGEPETATRLRWLEAAGLAGIVLGGAPIFASGASRKIIWFSSPILVAGTAAFTSSWLADIYGSFGSAPEGPVVGEGGALEMVSGLLVLDDPLLDVGFFSNTGLTARLPGFWISGLAQVAVDGDGQRGVVRGAYRMLGSLRGEAGSFFDLGTGATWQRFGAERFSLGSAELFVAGRFALERLGPSLRSLLASLELGYGFTVTRYEQSGVPADTSSLLIARIAFSSYRPWGLLEGWYDHRRDTLTGAISVPNQGSGFLGTFGARARYMIRASWGVEAELAVGGNRTLAVSAVWTPGVRLE